jgi:hypothetical protein
LYKATEIPTVIWVRILDFDKRQGSKPEAVEMPFPRAAAECQLLDPKGSANIRKETETVPM